MESNPSNRVPPLPSWTGFPSRVFNRGVLRTSERKPGTENAGQTYFRNSWKNPVNCKKIIMNQCPLSGKFTSMPRETWNCLTGVDNVPHYKGRGFEKIIDVFVGRDAAYCWSQERHSEIPPEAWSCEKRWLGGLRELTMVTRDYNGFLGFSPENLSWNKQFKNYYQLGAHVSNCCCLLVFRYIPGGGGIVSVSAGIVGMNSYGVCICYPFCWFLAAWNKNSLTET